VKSQELAAFLDSERIWCQVLRRPAGTIRRPALFLDRDGVITEEVNYLHRPEDIVLIDGAAEVLASANRLGLPVILVTNQAGIGRGYYGWEAFEHLQDALFAQLAALGALVDAVFACPYHPDGVGEYASDHPARKPRPGMLFRAAEMLDVSLRTSWMVGDKVSDVAAAQAASLRGGLLVLTGHGREHRNAALALRSPDFKVIVGRSILDALRLPGLFDESQAR
jgi:D-glycero-D-manno-heptose 1,7-bisphosphate phosphatase